MYSFVPVYSYCIRPSRQGNWGFSSVVLLLLLVCCSAAVSASVDTHFAPVLTVLQGDSEKTLRLTGKTKRTKYFLPIYDMAHYADISSKGPDTEAVDEFTRLLDTSGTKQISMVFSRDLNAKQIQRALIKGVQRNCQHNEWELVKDDLALFKQVINHDVSKNDRFALRWTGDGKLMSMYQDVVVSEIANPMLAKLLWSIWFGDKSVVNRTDLIQYL